MKPAIANMLVARFTEPGWTVLDPFSGCGTIPFEACEQGRQGLAVDLSPLAFCLSAAKVNAPSEADAMAVVRDLAGHIKGNGRAAICEDDEIRTFYHPHTLAEILAAKAFFEDREAAGDTPGEHWFVKSCVLHILHGNRPYALSRRSHGIIPIPPKGPTIYKSLVGSLLAKIRRMYAVPVAGSYVRGAAHEGSATDLPIRSRSVHAIITSPPFLGTTEFLRHNRVRLWFCGWNYERQAEVKARSAFLEQQKSLSGYDEILPEFSRVLIDNGLLIMHLGVVKQRDMAAELELIAERRGFSVLARMYEETGFLESHGRTDRGATHKHAFLFLKQERAPR